MALAVVSVGITGCSSSPGSTSAACDEAKARWDEAAANLIEHAQSDASAEESLKRQELDLDARWSDGELTYDDYRAQVEALRAKMISPAEYSYNEAGTERDRQCYPGGAEAYDKAQADEVAQEQVASSTAAEGELSSCSLGEARDSGTDPDLLDAWSTCPDVNVRAAVAANPSTRESTRNVLADSNEPEVLAGLLLNPKTPTFADRIDERFAASGPGTDLRVAVARRTSVNGALEAGASDADPAVRAATAGNPRASRELLARLAKDRDLGVRINVAGNTSAPPKTLSALESDPSPLVRRALVASAPFARQKRMSRDKSPEVLWTVYTGVITRAPTIAEAEAVQRAVCSTYRKLQDKASTPLASACRQGGS
jgi:hypothetical protein